MAPRVETPGSHQDFLVDPNPAMRYAPGSEVHLYWEMYNLEPDSTGTVRYTAEIRLTVQALERHSLVAEIVGGVLDAVGATAKGDDQVSVQYDVADVLGDRDRMPGWVAIDLRDAPNGSYLLELVITDRNSGQVAVRHRTFTVTDRTP